MFTENDKKIYLKGNLWFN